MLRFELALAKAARQRARRRWPEIDRDIREEN